MITQLSNWRSIWSFTWRMISPRSPNISDWRLVATKARIEPSIVRIKKFSLRTFSQQIWRLHFWLILLHDLILHTVTSIWNVRWLDRGWWPETAIRLIGFESKCFEIFFQEMEFWNVNLANWCVLYLPNMVTTDIEPCCTVKIPENTNAIGIEEENDPIIRAWYIGFRM